MKIEAKMKQDVDNKDNSVQLKPEDIQMLSMPNAPFSELVSMQLNPENADNLQSLSSINTDFNYDTLNMNIEDALFFINLANEGQFSVENSQAGEFKNLVQTDIVQNIVSQKTVEVTNQITALIEKAQKTQKPVRISFDNDVSVIIKIDKHGKITAEFIPGNTEVENYLRNNIQALRQRFDEQNLPYNELLYKQNSRQNRNRNKERGEN